MESQKFNDTATEARNLMQLEQLELFGLGRLMACLAQLRPTSKRKLFRGLLLAAVNDPTRVAVIERTGELIMLASVPLLASFASCSERSLQRYSRQLESEGLITQDRTINTAAEWSFNLNDVLPPESVPWFVSVVETGDPDCVCHPDCHPDSGVTKKAVTPTKSFCHPDSHPDNGVTERDLTAENIDSGMSYDLCSYVTSDITSKKHKDTGLNDADLSLLQNSFAAAKASGTRTLGSILANSSIDLGLRSFAAIDFADVQLIAGSTVNGEHWGLEKRRRILAAYFADAVKANVADRSEFAMFAANMCMVARLKPNPPDEGPDKRAGYVRTSWANRAWRTISASAHDRAVAAELLGETAGVEA